MGYKKTGRPNGRPRKDSLPSSETAFVEGVASTEGPQQLPTALPVPKKRQRPERARPVFAAGLSNVLKTGATIPYPTAGRAKPIRPARTMLRSPV